MPETSSASLRLAGHLRSLDDETLAALLVARGVRSAGIADFFDLADSLLDAASIDRALARLDRPTLAVLAAMAELQQSPLSKVAAGAPIAAPVVAARITALGGTLEIADGAGVAARVVDLVALGLAEGVEGAPVDPAALAWPQVADAIRRWPRVGLPGLTDLVTTSAPAALALVADRDPRFIDRGAAERAFAATTSVAELLAELQREPARELAKGGVALPDLRRLALATNAELDDVAALLSIAERAGLVAPETSRWMPTAAATTWLGLQSSSRWGALASAWHTALPGDVQGLLASRAHVVWGEPLRVWIDWLYPAGGEWMHDRLAAYTRDAELLGITALHSPTSAGVALLGATAADATSVMHELFPAEVDRVYLQHDLSIVSPGPLAAALGERLRVMADVEGHGLASSYRVSAASLTRALAAGESADSIRSFLAEISLTGIPQPLDYLIAETAKRHGLVRVGQMSEHEAARHLGARTYVTSVDLHLIGTLLVDQALAPLGLTRIGENRLSSRFERDVVFWSLADARYPIAAEDAAGTTIPVERHRARPRPLAATEGAELTLVRRLRAGAPSMETGDSAWIARQLELAVRTKVAVMVTVAMPNGSSVDYLLEPSSVAAGRLRARDRAADLERTLPLASISAIAPVD